MPPGMKQALARYGLWARDKVRVRVRLGLRLGLGKWLDLRSELGSVLWLGLQLHMFSNVPVSEICT